MGKNVELFWMLLCSFIEPLEVKRLIGAFAEPDAQRRPPIFMLDRAHTIIAENVVHVDQGKRRYVHHSVIADKHDIHDISQVACLEFSVKVLGEGVNVLER